MVVVLTSTSAGEGKSSTVAGLAGLLRLSGKRVAVIDLDLRRPRLGQLLEADTKALTINDLLVAPTEAWVRLTHGLSAQRFVVLPARESRDDVLPLLKPEHFNVPLTTTQSSLRAAGARVAERLITHVLNPEDALEREIWQAELILRDSTKPAPRR